ncbi:VOC family protein [Sabulicella rubraurantiaca]|uniref:VOC family protein n=1 Tax=Sabulicella rubraurantiaca TaxID=2811429 RepID=UPI001A96DFD1|nr:VOC family protein [Sabulicella rubraurantiaca]
MSAISLDHVGVCARDPGPLHAAYERLGFTLTPVARQSGGNPPVPLATGNRCAFLREGYLEFLAIFEPGLPDNGLGRMLDRYEGMHILALGIEDSEGNLQRLRAAGLDIPGIAHLQRPCDDPEGRLAKFERLPFPDAPEGRVQLIRHLTPELLWQERWMNHANGAVALEECFLVSAAPMESAARLSRLAGLPLEPRQGGGVQMRLRQGRVSILSPEEGVAVLPGVVPPDLPFLAGFAVRTGDGNASVRRLLGGMGLRELPDGALMVPPEAAGGTALIFRP